MGLSITPQKHFIGLVGFGTVARGLCQILLEQREYLLKEHQFDFEIVAVSTRSRGTMFSPTGLSLSMLKALAESDQPFTDHLRDWNSETMIRESNATVIVELTHTNLVSGSPAINHCRAAFETEKHVVSGNKGPAAVAYTALKELADQKGLAFLNEATVLSGTPLFSLIKTALAGNKIMGLRGILNGTTNFILSEMEAGNTYDQALQSADLLGYLEANKTADVEGFDAQAKLAILANILFKQSLNLDEIKRMGITGISALDVKTALLAGKHWKLVASLEIKENQLVAEVKPEALALSDPLSQVSGTLNAITFSTNLLGDVTITGPGAGSIETGYGILSDLLTINTGVFS